ncbi:MAG: Fur family transcriptional regulator [Acidimicrobiia bacterium]
MLDEAELGHFLRERGHRFTEPRRIVWEVLGSAQSHLTAEQIARRVQAADPGVNQSSVYRSLSLFAELGLARESNLGPEEAAHWELAHPDDQFHLICESCGEVQHHTGETIEQVKTHLATEHGFQARRVELFVSGLCRSCAEKQLG